MQPRILQHPYWLDPGDPAGFESFYSYLWRIVQTAPRPAQDELLTAPVLRPAKAGEDYVLQAMRPRGMPDPLTFNGTVELNSVVERLTLPFDSDELARAGDPRHVLPPRSMWKNAVAPILLTCIARNMLVACNVGATGMYSVALYRPEGGADNSPHKRAAAHDIRPFTHQQSHRVKLAQACIAAWLYQNGAALRVSVGTYSPGAIASVIHVDCGRKLRRTWTYAKDQPKLVWYGERTAGGFKPLDPRLAPMSVGDRHTLGRRLPTAVAIDITREENQPWLAA